MKKSSKVFLIAAVITAVVLYYVLCYTDEAADGLSTFFPGLILSTLLVCFGMSFILSLLPKASKGTIFYKIAIALPIVGFVSILGVIAYFSWDYTNQYKKQIEIEKQHLQTKTFVSRELGVQFQHVSGLMVGSSNGIPTIISITPKEENSTLLVPVHDSSFAHLDAFYWKQSKGGNTELISKLKQCGLDKVGEEVFKKLSSNYTVYQLPTLTLEEECKNLLAKPWSIPMETTPEIIYLLKEKENTQRVGVLLVYSAIQSAAAVAENKNVDDIKNYNKWYHTLEIIAH